MTTKFMLCYEGKLSVVCFCLSSILFFVLLTITLINELTPNIWGSYLWGPFLYFMAINIFLRFKFDSNDYQIAVRSTFLGCVVAFSLSVALLAPTCYKPFGFYATILSIFHYSEYLVIAWANPKTLSISAFMLNHSLHYTMAAVGSWIEFFIEVYFFPEMKEYYIMVIIGLILCIGGECIRKLAIITASTNFNHLVQHKKLPDHRLVTHGIYSKMRHPSYVGWFWWSIGTQIILSNPLCICIYTIVSWNFFNGRIYQEEATLLNFFGHEYFKYQKETPTGLPYIYGYELD